MASIYIHIPFCKQACHYCDFHFSTSLKKKDELLEALKNELFLRKDELDDIIDCIYFGGGTPSLLSAEELKSIIDSVYKHYKVSNNPEITLEANPDDLVQELSVRVNSSSKREELVSRTAFEDYKSIGINRLSIGIQSFFEEDLKLMNRAHNATEALTCIELAKDHFNNISIDLIYGIPGMTDERWRQNLEIALDLDIPHISSYALTVEPNTALKRFIEKGVIKPVDDDQAKAHFDILVNTMNKAGYTNYEFSNFGKEGYMSRNNTAYWTGKSYLGIGPSAHSFDGTQRSWNINNNSKYIKSLQQNEIPNEVEILSTTDRYNEYVMTGLRTIWGVSIKKVETDFGKNYKDYLLKQAETFIADHLLFLDGDTLVVTKKGKFLSDGIASELFMVNLS